MKYANNLHIREEREEFLKTLLGLHKMEIDQNRTKNEKCDYLT